MLLGKDSDKIKRFNHHALSVYGIGVELGALEWRSAIRQLTAAGLLTPDPNGHGGLRLTDKSRAVLRGEQPFLLRKHPPRKNADKKTTPRTAPAIQSLDDDDKTLFEELRKLCITLAREQSVPPYFIFPVSTLADMATKKPSDATALLAVSGVGQVKVDRYGVAFLEVINEFRGGRNDAASE